MPLKPSGSLYDHSDGDSSERKGRGVKAKKVERDTVEVMSTGHGPTRSAPLTAKCQSPSWRGQSRPARPTLYLSLASCLLLEFQGIPKGDWVTGTILQSFQKILIKLLP